MKKLQIEKDHKALIDSVVRQSVKFRGNEELIDIFTDAVYKKSYLLMDTIRDEERLKKHLFAICDSCIEQVLKEKRKFDETKIYRQIERNNKIQENIVKIKTSVLDDIKDINQDISSQMQAQKYKKDIVNLKEEIQRAEKYDAVDTLIDPLEFCPQKRISQHTIEKLIQIVKAIDNQYPNKKYYQIFFLRYIRRYKQSEIARDMAISQIELSKRFVELIKLTKENI